METASKVEASKRNKKQTKAKPAAAGLSLVKITEAQYRAYGNSAYTPIM